jgi:hypothetical protein
MRFIYIDTKGKEVSIPTVDALALRIELGAITETTKLYDEASDRWDPAGEHEIFRSIVREQKERSGGFVAPPPPSPAPAPPPPPPAAAAPPPQREPNPFAEVDGPLTPEAGQPTSPADPLGGLSFGLTLEPTAPVSEPSAPAERSDADFGLAMGSAPTTGDADAEATPAPAAVTPADMKADSFDFSGFGGMLTEDEGGGGDKVAGEPAAPPPAAPEPAADTGFALEESLAASYGEMPSDQAPAAGGHGMELEQPLSDLPIDQAGWSPKDRMKIETPEEEAAAAESGAERARAVDEQSGWPERAARAKPAPPPEGERKSSVPALIAAVVLLVVVGGGGWLGWSKLRDRQAAVTADTLTVDPPVALPALAPELEPRMREIADSAMADWLLALSTTLPTQLGVPIEPDRAWLSGAYLADAAQFASIEQYWQAVNRYVDELETRDVELFAGLFRARLDSARARLDSARLDSVGVAAEARVSAEAGVSAEDEQAMLERAQAGFLASRPDRRPIYEQLRNVTDAALGLHEFLVANEASIEYDPAAGGSSRDPVLEAVPATPELGKDMWDRVDRITQSLDALGALDLVTTERLLGLFAAKLGTVPIR